MKKWMMILLVLMLAVPLCAWAEDVQIERIQTSKSEGSPVEFPVGKWVSFQDGIGGNGGNLWFKVTAGDVRTNYTITIHKFDALAAYKLRIYDRNGEELSQTQIKENSSGLW